MARNPSVDIQDIGGSPVGVTTPLPVRLSDGAAFYAGSPSDLALGSAIGATASSTVVAMKNSAGNAAPFAGLSDNVDAVGLTGGGNVLRTIAEHYFFNGTSLDRARGDITNGLWVNIKSAVTLAALIRPTTSGGLTTFRLLAAATTNATVVKASAGQLYAYYIFNASAAAKFVKLYNKATAPTVGTDTPIITLPIAAGAAVSLDVNEGIPFSAGIGLAITGAVADADVTAVAANDVIVNLFYA